MAAAKPAAAPAAATAVAAADVKAVPAVPKGGPSALWSAAGGSMPPPTPQVAATLKAAADSITAVKQPDNTVIPATLLEFAVRVLQTHDTLEKCKLTLVAQQMWADGKLPLGLPTTATAEGKAAAAAAPLPQPPAKPARPTNLQSVKPAAMPKRAEQKDFAASRLALVHSLAHIESYAIDLAWDILVRFATNTSTGTFSLPPAGNAAAPAAGAGAAAPQQPAAAAAPAAATSPAPAPVALPQLPTEYFADWLRVAGEECRHFSIWNARLHELGSHYGALPVHDGLWQSAGDTAHDVLARLAIVHMVHEARGLDVTPKMLAQLSSGGDPSSADLLLRIEIDEITHVGAGVRWYRHLIRQHNVTLNGADAKVVDEKQTFHAIVKRYFRGNLIPPFATEQRAAAGFDESWYLPLVDPARLAALKLEQEKAAAEKLKHDTAAAERALKAAQKKQIAAAKAAEAKAKAGGAAAKEAAADDVTPSALDS